MGPTLSTICRKTTSHINPIATQEMDKDMYNTQIRFFVTDNECEQQQPYECEQQSQPRSRSPSFEKSEPKHTSTHNLHEHIETEPEEHQEEPVKEEPVEEEPVKEEPVEEEHVKEEPVKEEPVEEEPVEEEPVKIEEYNQTNNVCIDNDNANIANE